MPDRQEIIATNKSLRLIKNELESLLEKGIVDDSIFDQIMTILPAESPLSGATPASRQASVASPPPSHHNPISPPVNAMANLAMHTPSPAPPAYNTTGPPSLPHRNNPPPPPPPSKPIIAHAKALYKYNAADDRDLTFERDDKIAVFEYMNDDWWMGKNQRTGAEGIFPKNYVEIDHAQEKAGYYGAPAQPMYAPQQGGYPAPPQGQNPYNSSVPPMAVAEGSAGQQQQQPGEEGKMGKYGKKIGGKLGNAAIFGAGATLGGNLVNSIF
ncbi:SH3 domain-containing protein [Truncatella angustata]|uniref:Class E vacuolar protein-sorting machinery protein HSE1 n=1 Tax=Truncatella angustata TaxID=152316 RepID=A0A9P8RIZ4_9PEZI|nr:SH3 domain-containing protein [Truncatella angustata]KAH6646908.1 SH3 domain-containing protein [Truncatella angustata]KAH8196553.1 hypothetical protein TruAng_009281 [Truncatella angustata]